MALLYKFANGVLPEKLGPQAKIVGEALASLQPATTQQVSEAVEAAGGATALKSRQPVRTVVAFYLASWKRNNLVTTEDQPKPEAKPKAAKTKEPEAKATEQAPAKHGKTKVA